MRPPGATDHGEAVKVFLDDVRELSDVFWVDESWTIARSADDAIGLIETGLVEAISFDHDLGIGASGYDVLKHLIELIHDGRVQSPVVYFHSANPVGVHNMKQLWEGFLRRFPEFTPTSSPTRPCL